MDLRPSSTLTFQLARFGFSCDHGIAEVQENANMSEEGVQSSLAIIRGRGGVWKSVGAKGRFEEKGCCVARLEKTATDW